jgi:DNA primase
VAKTLLEILKEQNIELKESSDGRWVTNCPFHKNDSTPSFTVYPDGHYFCFGGGCGVWGDVVKFLVEYLNISSEDALEMVGIDYKPPKQDRKQVIKITNTISMWKFLYKVADEYHKFLMEIPGAQQYLHKRGLSLDTIKKYKIGYTDGDVLNIKWAEDAALAYQSGLVYRNGYEAMAHRITIPNLLDKGECDFIVGRTIINDKVKYYGTRLPKPIFGFHEVRHSPILFVAEGQFDYLTLRQAGYPAIVLGGSHLAKSYDPILSRKTLVVIPDQDESGLVAATELQNRFENVFILDYSDIGVKDVGEWGEKYNFEEVFAVKVLEQMGWIRLLSRRMLEKWLPPLAKLI